MEAFTDSLSFGHLDRFRDLDRNTWIRAVKHFPKPSRRRFDLVSRTIFDMMVTLKFCQSDRFRHFDREAQIRLIEPFRTPSVPCFSAAETVLVTYTKTLQCGSETVSDTLTDTVRCGNSDRLHQLLGRYPPIRHVVLFRTPRPTPFYSASRTASETLSRSCNAPCVTCSISPIYSGKANRTVSENLTELFRFGQSDCSDT